MDIRNSMTLEFDAKKENISCARVAVASFLLQLEPTVEETQDVKTAISEAVTNSIVHAYEETGGKVIVECFLGEKELKVRVIDKGKGIENIKEAMEPLFTTKASSEHSGMGFMFMQAFMDEVYVKSRPGEGCTVTMKKRIGSEMI